MTSQSLNSTLTVSTNEYFTQYLIHDEYNRGTDFNDSTTHKDNEQGARYSNTQHTKNTTNELAQ
jgi:hypothetical protein